MNTSLSSSNRSPHWKNDEASSLWEYQLPPEFKCRIFLMERNHRHPFRGSRLWGRRMERLPCYVLGDKDPDNHHCSGRGIQNLVNNTNGPFYQIPGDSKTCQDTDGHCYFIESELLPKVGVRVTQSSGKRGATCTAVGATQR